MSIFHYYIRTFENLSYFVKISKDIQFIPIKTRALLPPKDDIYPVLDKYLPRFKEGDILVITSKILGIHQGRCVRIEKDSLEEQEKLIMQEAEWYLPPKRRKGLKWHLTMKAKTLIANSGIDKSNGRGNYILWPKNQQKLLREIRTYLKKKFKLSKIGVISVDSHLVPLRTGTLSISTGFVGFEPWHDYRGEPDIFGRKLIYTKRNVVDSLAAISGFLMGEGNEKKPMVIIREAKMVRFTNKNTYRKLAYPLKQDIFYPLLKVYKRNKK
ncbi:MAG: coenzyme F420-0:L-glutamate ligase [bacterium]|nr:coenzyme F420-0:L-glutamate ligase [bacterium]